MAEEELYGEEIGEGEELGEGEGEGEEVGEDLEQGNEELDSLKRRLKEMEEEAARVKALSGGAPNSAAAGPSGAGAGAASTAAAAAAAAAAEAEKAEIDARSVYVGQVDYGCTPEELQQHFAQCGTVNRVTILTDRFGNPKGYAYVEFLEVDAVQNAVLLDNSELRGRQIKPADMYSESWGCTLQLNTVGGPEAHQCAGDEGGPRARARAGRARWILPAAPLRRRPWLLHAPLPRPGRLLRRATRVPAPRARPGSLLRPILGHLLDTDGARGASP